MTAFSNLRIVSRIRTIPAAEYIAEGEVYIVPREQPKEHHLVMKDNGNLFYVPPEEGFYGYVMDEKLYVQYSKDGWVTFVDNPSECLPVSGTREAPVGINIPRQQMSREFIQSFIVDKSVPAFWANIPGIIRTDTAKNLPFVPIYRDAESFAFEEDNPTEVVCNGDGSLVVSVALHFDPDHTWTSDARIDFVFRIGDTIVGRVSRSFSQSDNRPLLYTLPLPVVQGEVFTLGVGGDPDAMPVLLAALDTEQSFVCLYGYNEVGVTPEEILAELKKVDGAGSGLDADLLDGLNSDSFLRSAPALDEVLATGNLSGEHDITMNNGYALRTSLIKADGGQNAIDITPTLITVEPELKARDGISLGDGGSTAKTFKASTDFSNPDPFALVSESAVKAYVDANAGGGGGGGGSVGTLAQVLATGNTSGTNDLIVDTGQRLKADSILEATPGSGVSVEGIVFRNNGITVNSGTVKLAGNYPIGIDNVSLGADAGSRLSLTTSENVLIGSRAGKILSSGNKNTLLGHDAGSRLRSNTANTIIGSYTGSHNDLSITSSSNNVVLSDGNGVPVFHVSADPVNTQNNQANVLAGFTVRSSAVIKTILDDNTLSANRPDALATQASIKAYVDANAGGGGGGSIGTLSQVLAAGNTSGINGIIMDTGQAIQVDRIIESSPGTGVIVEDVLFRDGGIAVDGTVKLRGSFPVGTRNTALGGDAGDALVALASNNVLIGYSAGSKITSGKSNTLVGQGAGILLTTEENNTVIGGYNGSVLGLDIRGTDNNVVIANGSGTPILHGRTEGDNTLNIMADLSVNGTGAIHSILDEDDLASDSATALATQASIKAYVDANAGGGGGGGGSIGTLSQVLAAGNTSGANDIVMDRGQAIQVDTITEATPRAGVTVGDVYFGDHSFFVNGGLIRLRGSHLVGIENTVMGGYAGDAMVFPSPNNVLIGYSAGRRISSAQNNTLIGHGAGSLLTTEENNTIIGNYNGHGFDLDIRGTNNNVILSDGLGRVFLHGKTVDDTATVDLKGYLSVNTTGAIDSILNEDDMASDSATALATQSSIKAYVDASAGGTLSQVLAAGNTSGANGIVMDTGQVIQVDRIIESSPGAGVIVEDVVFRDGGIDVNSGTIKLHGSYPVGTENTVLGNNAGGELTALASYNVIIGGHAGTRIGSGRNNTLVGHGAGSLLTTEENNTIIGGYNGSILSLDIRSTNNNIIIANGSGTPIMHGRTEGDNTLNIMADLSINGTGAIHSILDEDDLASDSATALATQSSIKAYVDANAGGGGGGGGGEQKALGSFTLATHVTLNPLILERTSWDEDVITTRPDGTADFSLADFASRQWIQIHVEGIYRFHQRFVVRKDGGGDFVDLGVNMHSTVTRVGPWSLVSQNRFAGKIDFATSSSVIPPMPPDLTTGSEGIGSLEYSSSPVRIEAGSCVSFYLLYSERGHILEKGYTAFTVEQVA